MTGPKNSERLENIWLPNGLGEVMVSLSCRMCRDYSKLPAKRRNARTVVYLRGKDSPVFQTPSPIDLEREPERC
jgi:hypothetical protein